MLSIEQSLLFLLIIGRWLLPKGEITHDQLSQLLFVYIGIASDIMEILILFDEEPVLKSPALSFAILAMWSFSLMQYTLVLTATRGRKMRVTHPVYPKRRKSEVPLTGIRKLCSCCETELWSVLITCLMQDGPFLTIRMYVISAFEIFNYTILFYTCKNFLVLCLQFYRLTIVMGKHFYPEKFSDDSSSRNSSKNTDSQKVSKTAQKQRGNMFSQFRFGPTSNWRVARFAFHFGRRRPQPVKARLPNMNGNLRTYNSTTHISPHMIRANKMRLSVVRRRLQTGRAARKATISELYETDSEEYV